MSKLVDQWIDLFRVGDYSDKGKGVFSDQDVQQIVDNYDPANHEAPAGIGHVKGATAPAYGWFGKLRKVGDLLQGQMREADPAFEEAVKAKRFKKRSVELYQNANGKSGWSLRRVAFLGFDPPEVKGLADIQFAQEDKDSIEIEFSEETDMADTTNDAQVQGVVRKFLTELFNPSAALAAKTFSEEEVTRIATAAAEAAVKPLQAKLDAHDSEFSEAKKHLATATTKQRAVDAVNKLRGAGKWVPAFEKMGVPLLFEELAASPSTVEFGEADATTKKVPQVTPLDLAVQFFEGLKKIVPGDPVWNGKPADVAADISEFNKNGRAAVDQNSVRLDGQVRSFMEEHKVDYGTAMTAVIKKNPELARPGGAAGGEV